MNPADGSEASSLFQMIVVARWIHFASVFLLFGSALFWFYAGEGRRFADCGLPEARRATTALLRGAAPLAAITGLVWLAGILANMTNGLASVANPETLRLFFTQTQFGPVAILRLALLAIAVAVAVSPWRNSGFYSAMLSIGALLLIDQAWLGHAAEGGAGTYGALMIAVYCVHVLATGAWVGGFPPLLLALGEQGRRSPVKAREGEFDLLARYSAMAMVAVTLIVASGAANAGFRVGFSFDRLFDTDYGFVLATKVGVVFAMLSLAFFNRFIAMPRLRASSDGVAKQTARLRASVAFELFFGVLVLGSTAVLGVTPPPQ